MATQRALSTEQVAWFRPLGIIAAMGVATLVVAQVLEVSPMVATTAVVLAGMLGLSSVTDVRDRRIPNWATYSALGWGLFSNAWGSLAAMSAFAGTSNPAETFMPMSTNPLMVGDWLEGPIGIEASLLGAIACFAIMLLIHVAAGGGAGDVKLAAAIGSMIGVRQGILAIGYAYILAGLVTIVILLWQLGPWWVVKAIGRRGARLFLPVAIPRPTLEEQRVLNLSLPLAVFFLFGTPLAALDLEHLLP